MVNMKKIIIIFTIFFSFCNVSYGQSNIIFDFEKGNKGWLVPDWAIMQEDHVGKDLSISLDSNNETNNVLKLECDFPGDVWSAAVVEYEKEMDLTGYKSLSVDIFLPKEAVGDLYQARIIIVAGPWWWIQMRKSVHLINGKWNHIEANLNVGATELMYWKGRNRSECLQANISDVKKIIIRIEYNANPSQASKPYKGPIFIDNIVIKE